MLSEAPPDRLMPTAPPQSPSPSPPAVQAAPGNATMPAVVDNLPTIFGEVFERDVTFCVDTSGSMFSCLHVIKEHLIETLLKHAQRDGDTTFNIIEFSSEVTQWADKMVSCTPETVQVAANWIRKLEAKTGTNTMDALLTALQDSACQAVYLVTDGLPDSFAEDIIDIVVNAAKGRPIHCIYLARDKAEKAAVEFLEDLAVDSYGSLHIVTLTTHGCVERITPVYRSEHAHGRVIRTVNNTLRPNFKTCSVATTLQIDPEEVLNPASASSLRVPYMSPYFPSWWGWRYWGLGMFPYRYNFPSTWSRYRPAMSWLRAQDKLEDIPDGVGLSPSAGALLIGKQLLARRMADGYFYMATVQSQILDDKFLVAFGPCKHGKFRETTYQDTFVFDIVDYCDAMRHTVITGDHVLAPWEPEGDRYGPGIVIDGQERRQAVGYARGRGPEDHQMTVSFSNGQTEKVVLNKAIWIPQPVYERVSLELKMPRDARSTIMSTDQYPLHSRPGYPVSGPQATPREFYTPENFSLEPTSFYHNSGLWPSPYFCYYPPYPMVVRWKQQQKGDSVTSRVDEDDVIPGTDMTWKELDKHIMSQISEHTTQQIQTQGSSRLLKKREKLEENSLKKSVTFSDTDLIQTASEEPASDPRADADSGIASSPELDMDSLTKEQLDMIEEERYHIAMKRRWIEQEKQWLEEEEQRIQEAKNDPRLQFYRSQGIGKRPPWKYWRNDPCPPLPSHSSCGGSSGGGSGGWGSGGAFRETALQAPLEARDHKRSAITGSVEWTSPAFKYVDVFAKHDYSNSVQECLKTPHPPMTDPATGNFRVPEPHPPTDEEKAEAKRAYRRKRFMERQMAWQERLQNEDQMKALMKDNHRERIQAQINREQERQRQEQEMINRAREAKKKISKELRERIEEKQKEEKERDENRISAMKQRRERREAIAVERQKEIEETQKRRGEIRQQSSLARHNAVTERLNEEETRNDAISQQHRNAKLNRLHHFRTLEDQAQARKDLRVAVTDQHLALYRSQIFP